MNNCKLTSCRGINDSKLLIFNFQRQKKTSQTNKFQGSASHNMLLPEWNICRRFALRHVCNFFPPPRQIHLSFRESKQFGNYLVAVDVNRILNSETTPLSVKQECTEHSQIMWMRKIHNTFFICLERNRIITVIIVPLQIYVDDAQLAICIYKG